MAKSCRERAAIAIAIVEVATVDIRSLYPASSRHHL